MVNNNYGNMNMMNNNMNMMNNNMGNMNMMNNNMANMNMINNMNMMNNMNMINNMNMNPGVSMNSTLTRLKKEFQLCQQDSELCQIGCSFGLVNDNIFNWKVTMVGPKGTPYEGGLFTILIFFPTNYPKYGPDFRFQNKICHLNVDWRKNGVPGNGHICLTTLNEWKSTGKVEGKKGFGVKQALFDIFCLFYNQGKESPYDEKLAELYMKNKDKFNEEARRWTKKYAQII